MVLSIFSTIRTRRMGLCFFSSRLLAHHLCSPIRSSRMGSRRNAKGLMKEPSVEPKMWVMTRLHADGAKV